MASPSNNLLRYLSEYRTRSVSQSFEELLANSINIREGIRIIASTGHQNLRKFLQEECERDSGFPSVLSSVDSDFLGGSFARHTKTRPLDDIDIYLPLDGANLFYFEHGVRLPYTVLSDGLAWTPLLTSRWANGLYVSSSKLMEGFAGVIKRRFPQTKVRLGGQAVSIRMTQGETSTSDGLGHDVVPCFSLSPHQGNHGFYLMPDGRDGWMRTNPRYDAAVADLLQKDHDKNFRKTVKLLKYWNAEHLNGSLNSYFLELAIARTFWDKGVKSESVTVLSYGVALAFWAVQQAVLRGMQDSWIDGAPPVYPGNVLAGHLILLKSDADRACAAWEDEKANRIVAAASKWKRIFGDKFPD